MIRVWINDIEVEEEAIHRLRIAISNADLKNGQVLTEQYRNIEADETEILIATRDDVLNRVVPKIQRAISRVVSKE